MDSGCSNERSNPRRKLRKQIVAPDHVASVRNRCGVGKGWAGGQRRLLSFGHVGHCQRDFRCGARGDGQSPAFHRGEMLAHRVDFVDRGAAGDQRAIQRLHVFERDARIEWAIRPAPSLLRTARKKPGDFAIRAAEQIENCASGIEASIVRNRVARDNRAETTWAHPSGMLTGEPQFLPRENRARVSRKPARPWPPMPLPIATAQMRSNAARSNGAPFTKMLRTCARQVCAASMKEYRLPPESREKFAARIV